MTSTAPQLLPYLERLLNGETVEWKTLGEVCDIVKAASKLKSGDYCVSGKVPIIDQGAQYIAGYTDKELATIPKDEYIIFGDHTETIKFVDFEFVQGADGLKILHTKKALSKYVYYAFSNFYKKTASYKRHWSKAKETAIPLPPLRVQARIVEILDKFTQLEAELESELEARKKQYAYYRDQLLNFSQCPPLNVNIEWKTLGEVCHIVGRIGFRGYTRNDIVERGEGAISISPTNIINQHLNLSAEINTYISWEKYDESPEIKIEIGDIVLVKTGSTVGKTAIVRELIEKATINPQMVVLKEIQCSPAYLSHYINTPYFQLKLKSLCGQGSVPNISQTKLSTIPIPLPPLSEQRRIVDILDRFDTLTNSISEGLPKEIALRRKQYEYYRDALLNFPRAEVTA